MLSEAETYVHLRFTIYVCFLQRTVVGNCVLCKYNITRSVVPGIIVRRTSIDSIQVRTVQVL